MVVPSVIVAGRSWLLNSFWVARREVFRRACFSECILFKHALWNTSGRATQILLKPFKLSTACAPGAAHHLDGPEFFAGAVEGDDALLIQTDHQRLAVGQSRDRSRRLHGYFPA